MGHDLLIGWVNYKTKFLAIDDQSADVWVGMVVYVLCVQWTMCFSLAGLNFLWLEGGQFLWAVLVGHGSVVGIVLEIFGQSGG